MGLQSVVGNENLKFGDGQANGQQGIGQQGIGQQGTGQTKGQGNIQSGDKQRRN
jgi:hypothetical protein